MSTEHALPELDPAQFPVLSGVERRFFEYWWRHIVKPDDPQKLRWLALEERAVDNCADYVRWLSRELSLPGKRVLDVGCQNGATLVALAAAGATPSGIEIEATSVAGARVRLECHGIAAEQVLEGSAMSMPFPDASFEGVLASNVIEHVPDAETLIRECARVLAPGGTLYLDGPNRYSPRGFLSDPHYQLLGVSVLPGWLARKYVTRLRGFPAYDAETFPTASQTRRWLEHYGLDVLPASRLGPARAPRLVRDFLANLPPLFRVLARKHS